MSTFQEWLPTRLPGLLQGVWGTRWAAAFGAGLDELVERAKAGVEVRGVSIAPDDALEHHGRDRVMVRLPGESLDAYRARLVRAWETWSWAGTRYGIAAAVGLLGHGRPVVLTVRDYVIPHWPARKWAVLRIVFTGRGTWGAARWGGFAWGGRLAQPVEAIDDATLRAQLVPVLRTWINARDRVREVIIANGAPLWGRVRWGRFRWGALGPSRRLGPPRWGTMRWGAFPWGGFC